MSAGVLERTRPDLDDSPPIDMPPLNVIKCQCDMSCPASGSCELEADGDDLLCHKCRDAIEKITAFRSGIFTAAMGPLANIAARRSALHCHKCDPEFESDGDDDDGSNDIEAS
jgi:hypothetical protein